MNSMNRKIEITEANIEEMCRLAEDVMQQLYMNYIGYDEAGNDIFEKHFRKEADFEKEILPAIRREKEALIDHSDGGLLYHLFRRGDDIGKVRYYTSEDIRPWIESLIPKALQMFRKGTNANGECDYVAAPSVSDEYLIAAFSREVRNMMMIFAGQRMEEDEENGGDKGSGCEMGQEKEVYVMGLWEGFGEQSIYGVYTSKSKLLEGYRTIMEGDARCYTFSDPSDPSAYREPFIYRFNANEFIGEMPDWNEGRLYADEIKYRTSIEEVQEEIGEKGQ